MNPLPDNSIIPQTVVFMRHLHRESPNLFDTMGNYYDYPATSLYSSHDKCDYNLHSWPNTQPSLLCNQPNKCYIPAENLLRTDRQRRTLHAPPSGSRILYRTKYTVRRITPKRSSSRHHNFSLASIEYSAGDRRLGVFLLSRFFCRRDRIFLANLFHVSI